MVKYLTDMKVSNIQDFDWISQLRYYWKVNESECAFRLILPDFNTTINPQL